MSDYCVVSDDAIHLSTERPNDSSLPTRAIIKFRNIEVVENVGTRTRVSYKFGSHQRCFYVDDPEGKVCELIMKSMVRAS